MTDQKQKKTAYNEKHNQYTQAYIRENYKQLSIRIPKEGEITRENIAEAAGMIKMSTNAYILEAVREKMVRQGYIVDYSDV